MSIIKKEEMSFNDAYAKMYNSHEFNVKNVTFLVTESCNLRCTYCYEVHKNTKSIMTKEIGRRTVDMLFEEYEKNDGYINQKNSEAIILEFIGGEPLLEIDLINDIVEYFKFKAISSKHPWALRYMISMTTNGTLYNTPKVQEFVERNKNNLSITITIDGNRELHDACRIFPDGSGSYDIVERAIKSQLLYKTDASTKLTLAPQNVQYLVDAVKNLQKIGLAGIHANYVFEEGWTLDDAKLLYVKMKELADYLFEDNNLEKIYCTLFDENMGQPSRPDDNQNWCGGTGLMLAVATNGDIYPCLRYIPFTLANERDPYIIGDINNGIEHTEKQKNVVQILNAIDRKTQSTLECYNCPIGIGCGWCSGYNYDKFGTPDTRATFICVMHKARTMANVYFWNNYYRSNGWKNRFANTIPKEWALEIASEEEYEMLNALAADDYVETKSFIVSDESLDLTQFRDIMTIGYEADVLIPYLYECYMRNLKTLVSSDVFNIEMVSLSKIPANIADENWVCIGDKYLEETKSDKMALGKSIVENGTYWAMYVAKNENGERLIEGAHRYTSLSLLVDNNIIDNIDLPVMYIDETKAHNRPTNWFYVINPKCVNEEFTKRYANFYDQMYKEWDVVELDNYLLRVRGTNPYIATMMLTLVLRNMIYDKSKLDGSFYPARPELNDAELLKSYFYGG